MHNTTRNKILKQEEKKKKKKTVKESTAMLMFFQSPPPLSLSSASDNLISECVLSSYGLVSASQEKPLLPPDSFRFFHY
jgi:hypothetical protein